VHSIVLLHWFVNCLILVHILIRGYYSDISLCIDNLLLIRASVGTASDLVALSRCMDGTKPLVWRRPLISFRRSGRPSRRDSWSTGTGAVWSAPLHLWVRHRQLLVRHPTNWVNVERTDACLHLSHSIHRPGNAAIKRQKLRRRAIASRYIFCIDLEPELCV